MMDFLLTCGSSLGASAAGEGGKGNVAHKEQQEEAAHRDNYSYVRGWLFFIEDP
jgi:hypothetical protein